MRGNNNSRKSVKPDMVKGEARHMESAEDASLDPLLEEIKEEILSTNIDTLTPIDALMKLNEIKRMLTKK